MKLKYELAGTLKIAADEIDVTDPCYDKSVWCRTTKPIVPGEYNCYAGKGYSKTWGKRIYVLILLSKDVNFNGRDYDVSSVGTVGVDSGMAGFFENKPDYSDVDWGKICGFVFEGFGTERQKKFRVVDENSPMKCKGFFSESGIGDGVYDLFSIKKHDKLVGYKLMF